MDLCYTTCTCEITASLSLLLPHSIPVSISPPSVPHPPFPPSCLPPHHPPLLPCSLILRLPDLGKYLPNSPTQWKSRVWPGGRRADIGSLLAASAGTHHPVRGAIFMIVHQLHLCLLNWTPCRKVLEKKEDVKVIDGRENYSSKGYLQQNMLTLGFCCFHQVVVMYLVSYSSEKHCSVSEYHESWAYYIIYSIWKDQQSRNAQKLPEDIAFMWYSAFIPPNTYCTFL